MVDLDDFGSIDNEIDRLIEKQLSSFTTSEEERKIRPTRIRYKGKYLVMPSGKSLWKSVGHAKSALVWSEIMRATEYRYPKGYFIRGTNIPVKNNEIKKLEGFYRSRLYASVDFVGVE